MFGLMRQKGLGIVPNVPTLNNLEDKGGIVEAHSKKDFHKPKSSKDKSKLQAIESPQTPVNLWLKFTFRLVQLQAIINLLIY